MRTIVLKFGGKTISTIDELKVAGQRVSDCRRNGDEVVVVVSAMADETDRLIELAANVDGCGYRRELDHLLCTGEIKSASLLSMILLSMGIKSKSLNFTTLGLKTNSNYTNAQIESINVSNIKCLLEENIVPIIPGYQGIDEGGDVTTLGRGGSDITAVAVASALEADGCILFKDVGAIFYDDPKVNKNAEKFDKITYDELQELVDRGCRVVCKNSIHIAKASNLVLSIACPKTFNIGTLIYN